MREVLFREAVLSFLGVKDKKKISSQYCMACRQAKKDHCETCSKKFEVVHA